MKYLVCLLLCLIGLSVVGATVTGSVQTVTSSPYDDDNILFIPKSTPWPNGNNIVQSVTVRSASSNLNFSANLLGGVYLTKFTSGDQIYIYVPINDTNTYSFTFLSTNLLTMALINNPRVISSQVLIGTNGIIITTNNAGTSSETITISVGTIFASATNAIGNNNGVGTNTLVYGLAVTNGLTLYTNSTLYQIITPEMFGAKGDGSTDDSAAINACFNYAHLANSSVNSTRVLIKLAPAQSYSMSHSLFLLGGEIAEGNSVFWSGSFANPGTGNKNTFSFNGTNNIVCIPPQASGGLFGINLRRISLIGSAAKGQAGLVFGVTNTASGVQAPNLEDMTFVNFDTGMALTNVAELTANKITFYNCTNGIIEQQANGIDVNTFRSVNANCFNYGAQFFGSGQVSIKCDNWDVGNGGGVYVSGCSLQANNFNVEVNIGSGFEMVAADGAQVTVDQGLYSVMRAGIAPFVETNNGYFVFKGMNQGQIANDGNNVSLYVRNASLLSQWIGQSGIGYTNFAGANQKGFLSQTSLLPTALTNLDSRTFTQTNSEVFQNGVPSAYAFGADMNATTSTANSEKWFQLNSLAYEGGNNRVGLLTMDDSGPNNRVMGLGFNLGGGTQPDYINMYTHGTLQWQLDINGRLTYFSGPGTFRCNNVEDDAGLSVAGVYTNTFQGGGGGTAVMIFTNLAAGTAPNAVYPNGSFMTTSNGTFFVRSNNTWVQK